MSGILNPWLQLQDSERTGDKIMPIEMQNWSAFCEDDHTLLIAVTMSSGCEAGSGILGVLLFRISHLRSKKYLRTRYNVETTANAWFYHTKNANKQQYSLKKIQACVHLRKLATHVRHVT